MYDNMSPDPTDIPEDHESPLERRGQPAVRTIDPDRPTDPRAALADAMERVGLGHATEVLAADLAERGVRLVRNDPEWLHQYLHDEGVLTGNNECDWHLRVAEGALAALSGEE